MPPEKDQVIDRAWSSVFFYWKTERWSILKRSMKGASAPRKTRIVRQRVAAANKWWPGGNTSGQIGSPGS